MRTTRAILIPIPKKGICTAATGCHSHPYTQEREFALLRQLERHSTARYGWKGGSEDCPDQATDIQGTEEAGSCTS